MASASPLHPWDHTISHSHLAVLGDYDVGVGFLHLVHNNTGGSVLAAMLFHAMSNLSVWMFPYWQTDLGRYIGFGVAVVALTVVVLVWGPTHLARRPSASDSG